MKKTWKQWIAIACVLSMIACMLPAMTLAEDGVATPTDLTPVPEEPAGEELTEEPTEETGEEPEEDLPSLYFGNSGIRGTLKAGQEFSLVLHSEHSQNILITLTLTSGAGQAADSSVIRVFFNGEKKELAQIENDDPESTDVVLQFCAYVEKDNEYTITVAASADVDFFLTAVKRPDPEPEQEEESAPAEENKESGEAEENEESDETETIVIEPGETVAIRYWVSGLENDTQPGDTVTLRANADVELDGIPTWQVRNEQVEEGKWKRIGYGDHVTVEVAEGNEYRFIMQDGAVSEVLQLHITKDETAEEETEEKEDTEEAEETEDNEYTEETEETEDTEETEKTEETEETEETEQPEEVSEDGEPEEPETAEEETETSAPGEEPEEELTEEEPTDGPEEQETAEEPEEPAEEQPEEESAEEEPEEQEPTEEPEEEPAEEQPEELTEEEQPEAEEKPERHITVDVLWDVPDPVIGDTAHFVAVLEGYEGLQYTIQWQYSPNEEIWFDIPHATEPTMDVVVTEENNEVFWRILVFVEDDREI